MSMLKQKPGRPRADREEQRAKVCDAAWAVIGRHGLEGTTMREIAAELGATTGVLSHYFRNKQELLLFAICRKFDDLDAQFERGAALRPARAAILSLAETALPTDTQSRLEWSVYLSFLSQAPRNPDFLSEIKRRADTIKALTREILKRGMDDGQVPPGLDIALFTDEFQSLIEGLGLLAVVQEDRMPPERQSAILANALDRLFGDISS